ncbi:hypothetical protein HYPSUDRAFT_458623 [Hypholoma sublateritium FD-334 SS-4]|uniref:Uncharacterized protein n=1 Tax=Hypholoma sublateritium (strain FD-334 SS-4) TaxID=945553 RepID=A0A0D2KI55_HYPSF|nr:hypothetical protein HYPSUDRAFT_458623 [Hypholoma sublateritium FD-334 SS-4]
MHFQAPPPCIPHLASSAPLHSYSTGSYRQPRAAPSCVKMAPQERRISPHARTRASLLSPPRAPRTYPGSDLDHTKLISAAIFLEDIRHQSAPPGVPHDPRPTLHSLRANLSVSRPRLFIHISGSFLSIPWPALPSPSRHTIRPPNTLETLDLTSRLPPPA